MVLILDSTPSLFLIYIMLVLSSDLVSSPHQVRQISAWTLTRSLPPPAAPKTTRKARKKRSVEEAGKAVASPTPKQSRYPLRDRRQHQRFLAVDKVGVAWYIYTVCCCGR